MLLDNQINGFFCFFYKDLVDEHKIGGYFYAHIHAISTKFAMSLDVITQWELIGTSNIPFTILVDTDKMDLTILFLRVCRKLETQIISEKRYMQMLIDEWAECLRAADEFLIYLEGEYYSKFRSDK